MDGYTDLIRAIDEEIDREHAALAALSDDIFDHPEVSGQEARTCRKMVSLLRERGYRAETPFAGLPTAFRGVFGPDSHTHKIAILAEYDALPEIGHACGHCLSGSISILAALALRGFQDRLDADVHIIGTPAEEAMGGKAVMVKKGVFDRYDMAMMVHLYDRNLLASKLLAMDSYMYHFHGKAAHASNAPWEGINALNAAQLMLHAMDMLRQHVRPDVRMHAVIRNGGEAPNIVPEEASVEVYVRALDRRYLNDVVGKVDDCARGAAIATQAAWKKYPTAEPYDDLTSDRAGLDALKEVFQELGLPLDEDPDLIFGSSDVGNVSSVCPTFHPCLQAVERGVAIHTRAFANAMKTEMAYRALSDGARLIAHQAAKVFSDPARIQAMGRDLPKSGPRDGARQGSASGA